MSAYNTFSSNSYTPSYNYGYTPRTYTQPQYNTQQPIMPAQPIATDFPLRFANMEEAKAFIVMPNQRQFFLNNETSELYVKSADSIGQSFFDEYSIVPKNKQSAVVGDAVVQNTAETVTKDDLKDFVSKDYVSGLESQITALNGKVDKVLRISEIISPKKDKESD